MIGFAGLEIFIISKDYKTTKGKTSRFTFFVTDALNLEISSYFVGKHKKSPLADFSSTLKILKKTKKTTPPN